MWLHVARKVIKDKREHLCDLSDAYLPRVVKKQVEEALKGEEKVRGRSTKMVLNLLLRKSEVDKRIRTMKRER